MKFLHEANIFSTWNLQRTCNFTCPTKLALEILKVGVQIWGATHGPGPESEVKSAYFKIYYGRAPHTKLKCRNQNVTAIILFAVAPIKYCIISQKMAVLQKKNSHFYNAYEKYLSCINEREICTPRTTRFPLSIIKFLCSQVVQSLHRYHWNQPQKEHFSIIWHDHKNFLFSHRNIPNFDRMKTIYSSIQKNVNIPKQMHHLKMGLIWMEGKLQKCKNRLKNLHFLCLPMRFWN